MNEKQPPPRHTPRSRRDRLQALLFHAAAVGAAVLMALPDVKLPRSQGE